MILHSDNQTILCLASNLFFHENQKQIDCHFICEHMQMRAISTASVSTKHQQADIYTKSLGTNKFRKLTIKLGVYNPHALT